MNPFVAIDQSQINYWRLAPLSLTQSGSTPAAIWASKGGLVSLNKFFASRLCARLSAKNVSHFLRDDLRHSFFAELILVNLSPRPIVRTSKRRSAQTFTARLNVTRIGKQATPYIFSFIIQGDFFYIY